MNRPIPSVAARRVAKATRLVSSRPVHTPQAQGLATLLQQVAPVLVALGAGKSWAESQVGVKNEYRSAVQAICFAVLRRWGLAQALRAKLAPKKPAPYVDATLCAALALICAQDQKPAPFGAVFAEHVIVNQAVEAIKAQPRLSMQANFVNACLRRFLRDKTALLASVQSDLSAQFHHPAWWVRRLQADWPQDWERILQTGLHPAPLTLRINRQKCDVADMKSALIAANFIASSEGMAVAESGLQLARNLPVSRLPGYESGWFSVQDAAAQLAAPLLLDALLASSDAAPKHTPWRILDACAAPGGKTSHLLESAALRGMPVEVLALDVDPERCQRIRENLNRLCLTAEVKTADAAQTQDWYDGISFDAILLDAPCTASGIVRRHPDIPWLRRESDVSALAAEQKRLLNALWRVLRPGGVFLYCTCSVFKAEGGLQIESFVAHNTDALCLPAPGHLLPGNGAVSGAVLENSIGDHDGFFYSLLRKDC